MKRITAFIFRMIFICTLTGCGNTNNSTESSNARTQEPTMKIKRMLMPYLEKYKIEVEE